MTTSGPLLFGNERRGELVTSDNAVQWRAEGERKRPTRSCSAAAGWTELSQS
jgi:hypothetical protein